jgi:hypothetical protein
MKTTLIKKKYCSLKKIEWNNKNEVLFKNTVPLNLIYFNFYEY